MMAGSFNRQFVLLALLFAITGIASLCMNLPWLILIPFAVVLLPLILRVVITKLQWLYFLLLAVIPLSTEVNVTPTLGFDFPDEILMVMLTGLSLLVFIHRPKSFPTTVLRHPLFLLITVHLLWMVVATCFSINPWLSVKFLLAKVWFIIPFVVLPSVFLRSKKAIGVTSLCLLVPMLLVVLQSLFRHAFYGFSFEGIKDTLSPFFRNHVTYSAMLVCLLAVGWGMLQLTAANKKLQPVLLAGLWLGVAALVLSYSRGAWVALVVGVVAAFAIKKKWMGWLIGLAIIAVVAAMGWLTYNQNYLRFAPDYNTTIFHSELADHLEATVTLKDVSNAERFYRWVAAGNMAAAKPITGFSPNSFYPTYKLYSQTPFKTWVSDNPDHSTVHNYFLLVLVEQGFPGLIIFCVLYFGMLLYSQQLYHSITDKFYKVTALITGIVLAMIGSLIFINDLIETDKTGSLFWLCAGMLIVVKIQSSKATIHHP